MVSGRYMTTPLSMVSGRYTTTPLSMVSAVSVRRGLPLRERTLGIAGSTRTAWDLRRYTPTIVATAATTPTTTPPTSSDLPVVHDDDDDDESCDGVSSTASGASGVSPAAPAAAAPSTCAVAGMGTADADGVGDGSGVGEVDVDGVGVGVGVWDGDGVPVADATPACFGVPVGVAVGVAVPDGVDVAVADALGDAHVICRSSSAHCVKPGPAMSGPSRPPSRSHSASVVTHVSGGALVPWYAVEQYAASAMTARGFVPNVVHGQPQPGAAVKPALSDTPAAYVQTWSRAPTPWGVVVMDTPST